MCNERMKTLELTKEEQNLLKQYKRISPYILVRLKSEAILLIHEGVPVEIITRITDRTNWTIYQWIKEFREKRISSLFTGHAENQNAAKLTKEQKIEISKILQQPVTSTSILPEKFWSVKELKSYVYNRLGVVYESDQSYHFLLKLSNLSFKYPDAFNRRRDELKIEQQIEDIRKQLPKFQNNPEWEVFCVDETGLQEKNLIRRAWLQKGKKTVIKVSMEHENQSFIGFLNQKTYQFTSYEISKGNQLEMIRTRGLLKKQYSGKKLCIIWDNASFHKGIEIRKELRIGGKLENVYFIALPPYAPEKNPVEHVWNSVKGKLSKLVIKDFKDIVRKFLIMTNNQIFRYSF